MAPDPEVERWMRFLARFAPIVALVAMVLIVLFLGGVGISSSDDALGPDYVELLQAGRAPVAFPAAMVFDAFGWLAIGISLIAFSRIFQRSAPIASTFIFMAGVGHLLGFLGGILRMTGVANLGVMYAAATDPGTREMLRSSYLSFSKVIGGLFLAGDVVAALGWLLVGIAKRPAELPRWVPRWAMMSGILVAVFTPLSAVYGSTAAFPILFLYILSGVVVFHLVFAMKFWRRGAIQASLGATV